MRLLDNMRHVALMLQWTKSLSWLLIVLSLALFGYIVFSDHGIAQSDKYLSPSVVLLLWALAFKAFVSNFAHVPPVLDKSQGLFKRLRIRLIRFYYWLLTLVLAALTLGLLISTLKAVEIWHGS